MQPIKTERNLGPFHLNKTILAFLVIGLFSACDNLRNPKNASTENLQVSEDVHSFSNIHEISTKHLHLDLEVNFENKTIYGVARHQMSKHKCKKAIFDNRGLLIQKVTLGSKGNERETDFVIGKMDKDSLLGQPLVVNIEEKTEHINIYYQTTDKSDALQWLDKAQTSSKKHPFLYTQGEAILTRTWIPIQDAPGQRFTYSADVKVASELLPLMSAKNPTQKNTKGLYHFEMNKPISSYLIALAVGDIVYHPYDSKSGIYTEPEMIQSASQEFVDLPKMIQTAEQLFGPYQWGKYDVLVLPYSFPFGGMENPCLTFANPTIIAGDRSLVSVIAHELAHSWSGNLVTNSTWNDFWLNEGFTVYLEQRIMEELYGKDIADILAEIEFYELQNELKEISTGKHPEDSKLLLSLKGRDPDDGMTSVAYVKGAFFLKTLEQKVGRTELDKFLKNYFRDFQFKTINTHEFESYLEKNLLSPLNYTFNVGDWIHQTGIPKNCVIINSQRLNNMRSLAQRASLDPSIFDPQIKYIYKKIKGRRRLKKIEEISQIKKTDYITQEWQTFIRSLDPKIEVEKLNQIDQKLKFSRCGNSELMFEWFLFNVKRDNNRIKPSLRKFLVKVGRRKYILPLYTELANDELDKKWALDVFKQTKETYHTVSRNSIEKVFYR